MNWFPRCSKWCDFSCSKCDTKNVLPAPMNNKVFFFPKYIRSKILSNCSSLYSLFSPEFQSQPFSHGISRDFPGSMEFCWAKIPRSIRWKVSRNLHASGLSFQRGWPSNVPNGISHKKYVGTCTHTCGYLQNIYQLGVEASNYRTSCRISI
jgi:hypothetical protein